MRKTSIKIGTRKRFNHFNPVHIVVNPDSSDIHQDNVTARTPVVVRSSESRSLFPPLQYQWLRTVKWQNLACPYSVDY
jgi:hypothetical protein